MSPALTGKLPLATREAQLFLGCLKLEQKKKKLLMEIEDQVCKTTVSINKM